MQHPERLNYTKEHQWVRLENGEILIGLTDFAQHELGTIIEVDIPTVGKIVKRGEVLGTLRTHNRLQDLYMPVTGLVEEVNPILGKHPGIINDEPYAGGWIIKVKPDPAITMHNLLDAKSYRRWAGLD